MSRPTPAEYAALLQEQRNRKITTICENCNAEHICETGLLTDEQIAKLWNEYLIEVKTK